VTSRQIDHLVRMANQIALNCGAQRNAEESAHRTAEHLQKFWSPAMRAQLRQYWRQGGGGLLPPVCLLLESEREDSP
jgi:formate dehydrogenase subunit delta